MAAPADWIPSVLSETDTIKVGTLKGLKLDTAIKRDPHKVAALVKHGWIKLTRSAELSLDLAVQEAEDEQDDNSRYRSEERRW